MIVGWSGEATPSHDATVPRSVVVRALRIQAAASREACRFDKPTTAFNVMLML
jgi:hypothetical protein